MTKVAERAQARALRLAGHSYTEIAARLGVSKSSVSLWVRDLPRPTTHEQDYDARMAGARHWFAQRRRRVFIERQNEKLQWVNEIGPLTERELLIAGAVAYWAEGAKSKPWRPCERVDFINSDPDMIRLFMRLLKAFGVPMQRCGFRVTIHETADVEAAVAFWAEVIGVDASGFSTSTIKHHNPSSRRHNTGDGYHGCLVVRVHRGAELYRRIEGTWWAVHASARAHHERTD
jgi:transposase